jgi:hypothetical protein
MPDREKRPRHDHLVTSQYAKDYIASKALADYLTRCTFSTHQPCPKPATSAKRGTDIAQSPGFLLALQATHRSSFVMKTFHCNRCSQRVFFENVRCERCAALLGYLPQLRAISAFEDAGEARWRSLHPQADGALYKQCHNYAVENVCNWMIPADSPDTLCRACQLTRTIPNLSTPDNRLYWYRLEVAKRRLLYTLAELGLDVKSRRQDPQQGLAFEFLEDSGDGSRVMTGHDNGLITLNIAEADDAQREQARAHLHEPYRTLLGHFRHEIGHYYWDLLVLPTPWIEDFRALFGDDRADYAAALQTHYEQGPPPDWADRFVSSYASTHPWEDWAETWAHYLHMADTADTAMSFGVDATNVELTSDLFTAADLWQPDHPDAATFLDFINGWVLLTNVLNELSRSMGQPDFYPFVLPSPVIAKLHFIHLVIQQAGGRADQWVDI